MAAEELTCKEVVELVTDYLEGTMSDQDRLRFEEHVAGCEGCGRYLHQMRETIRLTGTLTEAQVPEPQKQALRSAFRDWKGGGAG